MNEFDNSSREAHFSKRVRAGKRTYYFDVKATRGNDYYLTITESKRKPGESEDRPFFEKHKLFLYKEDFDKFTEGLHEALGFIKQKREGEEGTSPEMYRESSATTETSPSHSTPEFVDQNSNFTDLSYDDLGK
ncbi:MAG: DUF3276 family protein [Bacteroidetes bacterium]|nr:DUF3276 family protein [Bacteroidota bacterium]